MGRTVDPAKRIPVLVELFTSEGCSSCPSADTLLMRLQQEQPVDGALIIPLSEHVDYWDNASWRDRFSSAKFSQRQGQYVQALHSNGAYTPQMVVDGQNEFVGSDEDTALNWISAATNRRKANVEVQTAPSAPGSFNAKVSITGLESTKHESENEVFVAITENNLGTHVQGGENGGRLLSHTAVVRSLQRIGEIQGGASFQSQVLLKVDSHWKAKDLSIVAFVQARKSGRILGAGITAL